MNYETLRLEVDGALARLTLARPRKRNALSPQTLTELRHALASINEDTAVRVLVLEGDGPAFSVGFDLAAMAALMMNGMPEEAELKETALLGQSVVLALDQLNAATVASAHGYAIGGGFLLLAACDFRIAANDTVFSIPEVDIGLPLLWGGVPLLIRELGVNVARDVIMTCRRFGLDDVASSEFVRSVAPEARREATDQFAALLLERPAGALRQTKEQFKSALGNDASGPSDADRFEKTVLHPEFLATAMAYIQRIQKR
jgi:enoyl-CoA hydratase/carnithine racemase